MGLRLVAAVRRAHLPRALPAAADAARSAQVALGADASSATTSTHFAASEKRYRFVHDLVRHAILMEITAATRGALHRGVGNLLAGQRARAGSCNFIGANSLTKIKRSDWSILTDRWSLIAESDSQPHVV